MRFNGDFRFYRSLRCQETNPKGSKLPDVSSVQCFDGSHFVRTGFLYVLFLSGRSDRSLLPDLQIVWNAFHHYSPGSFEYNT
jgi:hypothetical protein